VTAASQPIRARRMRQAFADGAVHCVADPLARVWEGYAENSKTQGSKTKALRTARQIRAFGDKYVNGIPEGQPMEEIGHMAHRHIKILDIFSKTYLEYNKRSVHKFHAFNSRENHIDVGEMYMGKATVVDEETFQTIVNEHKQRYRENKEFFMYDGVNNQEKCLRSTRGGWRVENPLHEIYETQNKLNHISEYGFDSVKFPEVNAFLKRSALIASAPVKLSDQVATKHHDLKAAYTQHAMTKRYEGFIGKIQQWRNVEAMPVNDVLARLCICEFQVLSNDHPLLLKLGLTVGSFQVLPSPEIKMFIDLGVSVRLVNAVFGSKFDLEYCDEVMQSLSQTTETIIEDEAPFHPDGLVEWVPMQETIVEERVISSKPYATWAGCLSHDNPKKEFNFTGSKEWAGHLASIYGRENVHYNNDRITVLIEKKMNYTKHHILAFITSYTRINVLEALLTIKNPCSVVLDGIYHNDNDVALPSEFREKPLKEHAYYGEGWYNLYDGSTEIAFTPCDPVLLNNCVLAGQGGCGKTYSIMTDSGFNNILYVVPQHMLGRDVHSKYKARYTTIHRLVGFDCQALKELEVTPAVCLIDELTMIEASWIEKAVEMYPDTLFFVAGDVAPGKNGLMWYQCRNGKPGEFSRIFDGAKMGLKTFTQDRRSRDQELKDLKLQLRDVMRSVFTDGGYNDAQRVADWIAKHFNVLDYASAYQLFANGDTWIAGTHRTNQKLLDNGVVSGYLSKQNEKSAIPVDGWNKRGSFTTHSFQGQTVDSGKIFVSINDAFEYAMIYTAVSRAVSFDQIVFVD